MSTSDRADRRWWRQAWEAVLEDAGPSAARRIQRGRALARRGAVEDLRIRAGEIRARVIEPREEPLPVVIGWPVASRSSWDGVVDTLASEVRFTAALLDAALPQELASMFAEAGIPLVPALDELRLTCSCPQRAPVCHHVAATHVAAGAVLERDLADLFTLRGHEGGALVRRVRADRAVGLPGRVHAGLDLTRGLETAHGDLDAVALHPTPADDPASLFRHLGPPPGVDDDRLLVEAIERAAAAAWRLAAGEGAEAADQELLVTQLRAQRTASAGSLAAALGRDVDAVRSELDRLFTAGIVLRTGSGETARYRASSG